MEVMTAYSTEHERSTLDKIKSLQTREFDLWKYYEERADRLGERLWSIGIWFTTILGGILSIPFAAHFINPATSGLPLEVVSPLPVTVLSVFGILLSLYAYIVLSDVREHIEKNWQRSGYALEGSWAASSWTGRRNHAWKVLLVVVILAFLGFAALITLSVVRWTAW